MCDEAKNEYIEENDWLKRFITDCCVEDEKEHQASGIMYKAYRKWCNEVGEWPKRNSDFNNALENAGYISKKSKKGNEWLGIALTSEILQKTNDNTSIL